jgi:hypothetical protein
VLDVLCSGLDQASPNEQQGEERNEWEEYAVQKQGWLEKSAVLNRGIWILYMALIKITMNITSVVGLTRRSISL